MKKLLIILLLFLVILIIPVVYSDSLPSFNTTIYDFNIITLDALAGQSGIADVDFGTDPDVLFGVLITSNLLVAYNVSDPSAITIISTFDFETSPLDFSGPRRIEVDNDDIAVITFAVNRSFAIMNVSNPASIAILGNITQLQLFNGFQNIKKVGDFVYGTAGDANAFIIINASDLRNPFITSNITGAGSPNFLNFPWDIGVQDDIAYVASGSDVGVTIINVTDKRNPVVINHTPVGQAGFGEFFTNSIIVRDNLLMVDTFDSDGSDTITLLDVTDPSSPVILDSISSSQAGGPDFLFDGNDLEFSDVEGFTDIVFHVAFSDNAITLINISDTSNIRTVGVLEGAGSPNFLSGANQIIIQDDILYAASFEDSALVAFRWIQPITPTPIIVPLPLQGVAEIAAMIALIFLVITFFTQMIKK